MLICFYLIDTKDNGSLEVPHGGIDDDRYDMAVECGAAGLLAPQAKIMPLDSATKL